MCSDDAENHPESRTGHDQPRRIQPEAEEDGARDEQRRRPEVHDRYPAQLPRDNGHEREGADRHAIEDRRYEAGLPQARHEGTAGGDEEEGGQEDGERGDGRAGPAASR